MSMALEKKDNQVMIRLTGRLTRNEFDRGIPEIARMTEDEDHACLCVDVQEFEGWDPSSSWESLLNNGTPRFSNIDKIAFVGDKSWSNWMRGFRRMFVDARVRFFGPEEARCAVEWLAA